MNDTIKERLLKEEIAFLKDKYRANLLYLLALLTGTISLVAQMIFDINKVHTFSILFLFYGIISSLGFLYYLDKIDKQIRYKFKQIKELIHDD